jgi:hypothetical protein
VSDTIEQDQDRRDVASPRHAVPQPWSAEENAAVVAAVQQHMAAHRFLDWAAIAAAIPGRSPGSAEVHYYVLRSGPLAPRAEHVRPQAVAAPPVRRKCLCCRAPFDSEDRRRNWICDKCKQSDRQDRHGMF